MEDMLKILISGIAEMSMGFVMNLVRSKVEEVEMSFFHEDGKKKARIVVESVTNLLGVMGVKVPENLQAIIDTVVAENNRTKHFITKAELKEMRKAQEAMARKAQVIQQPQILMGQGPPDLRIV